MKDMDAEMQEWITLHETDDPLRLRLRFRGNEGINQAIMQIECRRKAASRLPVTLANKAFMFPTSLSAEQATSEPLAKIHADIAGYTTGSRHLDLTCGLAIDSFEAARRGASVTAVDIDSEVIRAAAHNARVLDLEANFKGINADSSEFIANTNGLWDTIFIDPARRGDGGKKITAITDCRPDVTPMLAPILSLAPKIIIKASPMLDMTAVANELNSAAHGKGTVTRMIAVGTTRECKEIVAVIERGTSAGYTIESVTALPSPDNYNIFKVDSESKAAPTVTESPRPGTYLYEPYPSVMKTSAWGNLAAIDPSLAQLHPNTHLFVSTQPVEAFPGTAMIIERVENFNDKNLKSIAKDFPKLNVATRNFIISAPELTKRLRVKEGGDKRLYGVRMGVSGSLVLLLCSPTQS